MSVEYLNKSEPKADEEYSLKEARTVLGEVLTAGVSESRVKTWLKDQGFSPDDVEKAMEKAHEHHTELSVAFARQKAMEGAVLIIVSIILSGTFLSWAGGWRQLAFVTGGATLIGVFELLASLRILKSFQNEALDISQEFSPESK
jgi:hypothetical protein